MRTYLQQLHPLPLKKSSTSIFPRKNTTSHINSHLFHQTRKPDSQYLNFDNRSAPKKRDRKTPFAFSPIKLPSPPSENSFKHQGSASQVCKRLQVSTRLFAFVPTPFFLCPASHTPRIYWLLYIRSPLFLIQPPLHLDHPVFSSTRTECKSKWK